MMELGQAFRGEHAEIMSFVSGTVDSELSGNMIDLCPVGALTSKPFRYSARTWELSRRKSVSPHDSLGSNLAVQVKDNRVMRVLPIENEAINECWISDKDRFSYEGLNSAERLTKPMIKQGGKWQEVEWQVALEYVANGLRQIKTGAGAEHIGALATPQLHAGRNVSAAKTGARTGQQQRRFPFAPVRFQCGWQTSSARPGWVWLWLISTRRIASCWWAASCARIIRCWQREYARQSSAARRPMCVHSADDDLLMKVANKAIVAPSEMVTVLAQILQALAAEKTSCVDAERSAIAAGCSDIRTAQAIAKSLASGERTVILLGNFAQQHPQAAQLQLLAQHIAAL